MIRGRSLAVAVAARQDAKPARAVQGMSRRDSVHPKGKATPCFDRCTVAPVAQRIEHPFRTAEVAGSIPAGGTDSASTWPAWSN
jgi:hypothetical protein